MSEHTRGAPASGHRDSDEGLFTVWKSGKLKMTYPTIRIVTISAGALPKEVCLTDGETRSIGLEIKDPVV